MSMPPLPTHAVPLVGQPLTVVSTTILPLVQCHCSHGGSLVLVATVRAEGIKTAPEYCPACGRQFLLKGFSQNAAGQFQYAIEMSEPRRDS